MGDTVSLDSKEFIDVKYKGKNVFSGYVEKMRQESEIHCLIKKYQQTGDLRSRDIILESHTRVVYSQAIELAQKIDTHPDDYIGEGFLGLQIAIDKFDPAKGVKFTTYAIKNIKNRLNIYYKRNMISISLPHNLVTYVFIAEAIYGKRWENDRKLAEEYAKEKNISLENLLQVNKLLRSRKNIIFQDEDDDHPYYREDKKSKAPPELILLQEQKDTVLKTTEELKEKHKRIIEMRFALHEPYKNYTLEEIGQIEKTSHSAVRQVEERALRILKEKLERTRLYVA